MKRLFTYMSAIFFSLFIVITPIANAESQSVNQGVSATLVSGDKKPTENIDTDGNGKTNPSNEDSDSKETGKKDSDKGNKVDFFKTGAKEQKLFAYGIAFVIIFGGLYLLLVKNKKDDDKDTDDEESK